MKAFEDGERVRYRGITGLHSKWDGLEGVVKGSYRDFDGNRVEVLLDGEKYAIFFDEDNLEPVKSTYEIENMAEDSTWVELELTDAEAALLQRVISGLNEGKPTYAPTLVLTKKQS